MGEDAKARKTIIGALYSLSLFFCAMSMAQWWRIAADWPSWRFYAIMAVFGVVSGILTWNRYIIPATVGFVIGGIGALFFAALVLHFTPIMYTGIFLILCCIGSLPGVVAYLSLSWLQDRVFGAPIRNCRQGVR